MVLALLLIGGILVGATWGLMKLLEPPKAHRELQSRPPKPPTHHRESSIDEIVRQQKTEIDARAERMMNEINAAIEREYAAERTTETGDEPVPPFGPAAPRPASSRNNSSGGYKPPPPSGAPVEPWGQGFSYEVVGEAYYGDNIARLFRGIPEFRQDGGAELRGPATLVAAPDNPYGQGHAVAVWIGGQHVGYIASEDAARHFPRVMRLRERGEELVLDGRLWARKDGSRVRARATIWLPDPAEYEAPPGFIPDAPHVVLPAGGRIQVTKEDEHMDVLSRHVIPDARRMVAATLHVAEEIRPRSKVEMIEVRIRGQRVGVLSAAQAKNFRPLVDRAVTKGVDVVVRAEVAGNSVKADVVLFAAKAQDVPQAWIDANL